jgi:16S rRNA (cytidine1402-2'-O)-methyltransferase
MRFMSGGQLILAATPLGNILDASPRLEETLEQADLIAAEDTRRAKRLFADLNLEIKAPVISLFDLYSSIKACASVPTVADGAF